MAIDDTWHDRSIRVQKAEVARWFGAVAGQAAFFARDGRAYPLSDREMDGLKALAEQDAIDVMIRLERRIWLIAGIVLATVIGGKMLFPVRTEPMKSIVDWALAAIWSGHGIWLLVEGIRGTRATMAVRDRVEQALAGRAALRDLSGERRFFDPWAKIALGLVIGLFALAVGSEMAGHFGIDIISAIPPWIYIWLLAMFALLAAASKVTLMLRVRK